MTDPISDTNATPNTEPLPPAQPTDASALTMMIQLQQQQMAMQQQMATLMSQLIPSNAQQKERTARVKPARPTIDADSSDNKWIIFTDAWNRYKEMSKLTDANEIRNELRSACSTVVNEMLFNFVGPEALNVASETELLKFIKSVAVKSVHPEVYRQQFFGLRQTDGESITAFVSRLKSQAMLCDFVKRCSCTNDTSFSEDMIKSQLIAGLCNADHQTRILSEVSSLQTLKQVVERLLTLESTARATSHLQPVVSGSNVAPIKSDYQRSKNSFSKPRYPTPGNNKSATYPNAASSPVQSPPPNRTPSLPSKGQLCRGCGKPRHTSRQHCPAYGRTCSKCGKYNHFAAVCMSARINVIAEDVADPNEGEEVSFLATITTPSPL